ncbi:MAG: anaerobic sulfatase maturase [Bacteroidales bacterium]|nr:anaerobic sulfatase maturase [Bacteroidales bacterium]
MTAATREFQVFVKPAGARCNLSCHYCYYLEKSSLSSQSGRAVMSDEVLDMYIRQHLEAAGGNEAFFSWHGGEPMTAGLAFYKKAVALQKRYRPDDKVIVNGIQTNATLIDEEWAQFFKREKFIAGVSLDGPAVYHDSNRRRRDDTGTFPDVLRGIDLLKRHEVPFEILCVVSSANISHPLEIYSFFRTLGTEYITFLPLVEFMPSENKKVSARSVEPVEFGNFLAAIFDEWIENDIGRIKVQVFEEALRSAFGQDHTLCIFRKRCGGVPVLEMNGNFYSCDHYVNAAHLVGNIRDASLSELLDHPDQSAFGQLKWDTLPRYCLECEVLDMCNGECPRNRFIETPSGERGLNYLCSGYRFFFNHCKPFVGEVARVWRQQRYTSF